MLHSLEIKNGISCINYALLTINCNPHLILHINYVGGCYFFLFGVTIYVHGVLILTSFSNVSVFKASVEALDYKLE